MNPKFKFRAWYKPDFKTKDGPLKFIQQTNPETEEVEFVMEGDPESVYKFFVPFSDSDWIVEQWTGLLDKNGKEIYEGDIVRQRTAERFYQEHYGENIPTPDNIYNEQLEPYIKTRYRSVVFANGAFTLGEENLLDDFVFPLANEIFSYNKESMIEGFEECKLRIPWDDSEEGDLQYLLNEYDLKSEEELINYLGLEVVGNIHQNPELLK